MTVRDSFTREDYRYLAVLLGMVLVVFFEPLTSPDELVHTAWSDLHKMSYPWRYFFHQSVPAGNVAFWNPYNGLGRPFIANVQAMHFFPVNVLFYVMPTNLAFSYGFALLVYLAGVTTYLFLYEFDVSRGGRFVGAASFMLCSQIVYRVFAGHYMVVATIAVIPLLFYATERAIRTPSPRRIVALGVVFALSAFAGHTQLTLYAVLLLAVYGSLRAYDHLGVTQVGAKRLLGVFGTAGLLGVAFAAVQLVPTFVYSQMSVRSGGIPFADAVNNSFTPLRLIRLLLPNAFGNIYYGDYLNQSFVYAGNVSYWETAIYVGAGAVVFAAIALAGRTRNTHVRNFAIVGLIALVLSFGALSPVYWAAFELVPMFDSFRIPGRFLPFVSFAIAVLAAFGFDVARNRELRNRDAKFVYLFATLSVVSLGAVAYWTKTIPPFELAPNGNAQLTVILASDLLRLSCVAIGLAAAFRVRERGSWTGFRQLVCFVVVANLLVYQAPAVASEDVNELYPELNIPDSENRIYDATDELHNRGKNAVIEGNGNILYDLKMLGYDYDVPLESSYRSLDRLQTRRLRTNEALLDRLNVEYVIVTSKQASIADEGNRRNVSTFDDDGTTYHVYRNTDANAVLYTTDADETSARNLQPTIRSPNRIEWTGDEVASGRLVISRAWHPSWQLWVDGQQVRLSPTDDGTMSASLPADVETISVVYRPTFVYAGGVVSVLSLTFAAVLVWRRDSWFLQQ